MYKLKDLISKYEVTKYRNGYIFESQSLSKVWSHSKKGFVIMSAFRGHLDIEDNLKRHQKLKSNLKKYGLGFWEVDGVYI